MTNLSLVVKHWLGMSEEERSEFRKLISNVQPEETLNYQEAHRVANKITRITYPQLTKALINGYIVALTPIGGVETQGYGKFVGDGKLEEGEEHRWQVNKMSLLAYARSYDEQIA